MLFYKPIIPQDIAEFLQELSILSVSGFSIPESLAVLEEDQEKPRMRNLIRELRVKTEHGETFGTALAAYPQHFEPFFTDVLKQAENSSLNEKLQEIAACRVARDLRESDVLSRFANLIKYMGAMSVLILFFLLMMMVFFFPEFSDFFKGFGAELPALTNAVIGLSNVIVDYGFLFLGIVVIMSVAFISSKKLRSFFILATPGVGKLYERILLRRMLYNMAFSIKQGQSTVQALANAAQGVNDPVYAEKIKRLSDIAAMQNDLKKTLRGKLPSRIVRMLEIGGKNGKLPELLEQTADLYNQQAMRHSELVYRSASGIMTIFFGGLVFVLILAIYLPIFKMGSAV